MSVKYYLVFDCPKTGKPAKIEMPNYFGISHNKMLVHLNRLCVSFNKTHGHGTHKMLITYKERS